MQAVCQIFEVCFVQPKPQIFVFYSRNLKYLFCTAQISNICFLQPKPQIFVLYNRNLKYLFCTAQTSKVVIFAPVEYIIEIIIVSLMEQPMS